MKRQYSLFWFCILILALILSCGASKPLATTTKVETDTTTVLEIRKVDYKPLASLNLEIGKSLYIPELRLTVTRLSKNEALVENQTKLVRSNTKEVEFIATKQVDRSKDKSVNDSNVNSKLKDKSQKDSNNKAKKAGNTKVKPNNKQVTKGRSWALLLIPLILFGAYWYWKKKLRI